MLTKERKIRKKRIRAKIIGTSKVPRVTVHRSNKYMYAQIIDDEKGVTLAAAKAVSASDLGKDLSEKAMKKKIKKVVFDRSGYQYHGKIKVIADELRAGGLVF